MMKKKNLLRSRLPLFTLSVVTTVLVLGPGCTKQRETQELDKFNNERKESINQNDVFIYTPGTSQAQRSATVARPNWLGEAKLVKFAFKENALEAYEIERDPRFSENPTNRKPVMSIPLEYHEYRCQLNSSNECSNKEEENPNVAWFQKSMFKFKVDGPKVSEVNTLPIDLENLYGECYKEMDSHFVSYKIEPDAVNFDVERIYKVANPECLESDLTSLSDAAFVVRNHYSFVKLSSLISPKYKPVIYPDTDQNTFGFFTTVQRTLSVDNNDETNGEVTFLNRWNPERREIVYTMDDSFNKPENAELKQGSYKAFEAINDGFARAGVALRFKLIEPNGATPGDLRTNMILNVEDPEDGGLLGYGPTVTNPDSGEILHGQVSMYAGNMRKYIKRAWDEFVEIQNGTGATPDGVKYIVAKGRLSRVFDVLKINSDGTALSAQTSGASDDSAKESNRAQLGKFALSSRPSRADQNAKLSNVSLDALVHIKKDILNYTAHSQARSNSLVNLQTSKSEEDFNEDTSLIPNGSDILKKYGFYLAEEFNFDDAISMVNAKLDPSFPRKHWAELSAAQRDTVLKTVMPLVWTPVLIHELGHNMGLRHNFAGSEDKANFYSDEELQKLKVTQPIPYSSVMDYGFKELNQLQAMGKYDVAAFRFAYARKVESSDGSLVSVPETLDELNADLKAYKYCTDEHVGINPGCRRFDQGTTYSEIAQFYVDSYNKYYYRRNSRSQTPYFSKNGTRSFSLVGHHGDREAVASASSTMRNLRIFFDVFEGVQAKAHMAPSLWLRLRAAPDDKLTEWLVSEGLSETVAKRVLPIFAFYKDIDKAAVIARDFFLSTMVTPDLMCMLAKPEDLTSDGHLPPVDKAIFLPYSALSRNANQKPGSSCFELNAFSDDQLKDYVVVAEGGRLFNSARSLKSDNHYLDQVDIRGNWPDKIAASKALFQRVLGDDSLDQYTGNFVDSQPGSAEVIAAVMQQILSDQLLAEVPFRSPKGEVLPVKLAYSLFSNHVIPSLLDRSLGRALGFGNQPIHYYQPMLRHLHKYMSSTLDNPENNKFRDLFSAYSTLEGNSLPEDQFDQYVIGSKQTFALKGVNGMAQDLIEGAKILEDLGNISDDHMKAVMMESISYQMEIAKKAQRSAQGSDGDASNAPATNSSAIVPAAVSAVPAPAANSSPAPDASAVPSPDSSASPLATASPSPEVAVVLSADEIAAAHRHTPKQILAYLQGRYESRFKASDTLLKYQQILDLMAR